MENTNFADLKEEKAEIQNTYINIGIGKDISIKELAERIQEIVSFKGEIIWDSTKPDGTPQKLLNVDKIYGLGWKPGINFEEGIKRVYESF